MNTSRKRWTGIASIIFSGIFVLGGIFSGHLIATQSGRRQDLDERVRNFLERNRHLWRDVNVPEADGKILHDLIIQNNHRRVLEGPFDFVFIDADKDWYVNYARAIIPKLEAGGCIAAHNVHASQLGRRRWRTGGDYYEFMANQAGFETFIHPDSWSGLAISFRKKDE